MEIDKILTGSTKTIIILITLVFLGEILLTLLLNFTNIETTRFLAVYKLIFQFFLIISISFKSINIKNFWLIIALGIFFIVNQVWFNPIFFDSINFQLLEGSIYFFDKYIYIFIFILAFCSWKGKIQILNKSIYIIEKILIVNALFIIFGFLFEIDFLKSYPGSQRFGYDGLFTNRNQLSSLYLIFTARVYFEFLQNSSKFRLLLFLIFVSILIGTKIILLFLFLILVYHFCFILKKKVIYRILIGCLVFGLIIYFESIATYLFNLFPFWVNIGESLSLRSMLFSTRDLVFIQSIDYIKENWIVLNYFIGGSFYTKTFRLIEMDFFAPIMIFGLLGFMSYMILIKEYFFEKNNFIRNSIILIIVLCGFLGGGLFISTPAMIYLYLMSESMKKSL